MNYQTLRVRSKLKTSNKGFIKLFSQSDFKISVVLSNPTDNEGNPVESIVSGGGLAHDYKFHSFHFHWVRNEFRKFFYSLHYNRSARFYFVLSINLLSLSQGISGSLIYLFPHKFYPKSYVPSSNPLMCLHLQGTSNGQGGSEHTVNGKHYFSEVHLVHHRADCPSLGDCLQYSGER